MTIAESDTRAERKRSEILEAARRRFINEGYAGAGMEAIAREAGISTATLYDLFACKADLFSCVAEGAIACTAVAIKAATEARGDETARLHAFAAGYARLLTDPSAQLLIRVFAAEPRRFEALAGRFWAEGRGAFLEALTQLICRLNDEGRLLAGSPSVAAAQLLGMVEHAALVGVVLAGEPTPSPRLLEQTSREAVATFLARYGLRSAAEAA